VRNCGPIYGRHLSPGRSRRTSVRSRRNSETHHESDETPAADDEKWVLFTASTSEAAFGSTAKRPVCTLSRLNRSTVFPPLVVPKIECSELSLSKIINFVRQRHTADVRSHLLLDFLSTASGLSVATCAELLVAEKIIEEPLDPIDIAATCAARLFWTLYAEGRALYSEMVAERNVPRATGDFGFFDRYGLEALLPGAILPDHCRRREFITNYLAESDSSCLDLYSVTGLPLVRHSFSSTLNPLLFGHASTTGSRHRKFSGFD